VALTVASLLGQMDEQLAASLRNRFQYAREARKPYDKNLKLNLAYLAGLQWVEDKQQPDVFVDLRDLPSPSWRARLVDNKVLGVYQGLLGRFMASPITPVVTPVGPDPQNTLAARAATRILHHLYSLEGDDGALGLEHQLWMLYGWLIAAGCVYLYGYWDPDAYAETMGGLKQVGDVRTLVLSPFEIFADPAAALFDQAHWCFRTVVRNIDEVKLAWPQETKKLQPESLRPEIPLPNGSGSAQRSGLWLRPQTIRDSVMLREYFERPSSKYPDGRYAIYVGQEKPILLRYDEELPYSHRLPIRQVGFIRLPGANNPMGVIDQLRDPQRYLNEVRSRRIEHVRMMAAGKWIVDRSANIDKDSITSEPGEVIFKETTGAVQHVSMQPLPEDVQIEVQELEQSISQIAQLRSLGASAPGGGRSTAVEAMIQREIEDLARAPFFAEVKSVLQRFYRDCLEIVKTHYLEPRLMRFGSGIEAEIDAFEGKDLEGTWDVKVNLNTQGPMSRSERIQVGMQFLELGIFGQAGQEKTIERFLQFTGMGAMMSNPPASVDAEIAEEENSGMLGGKSYTPGQLDNHEVHLERHLDAFKKASMDPSSKPAVLQEMDAHIQTHMKFYGGALPQPGAAQPQQAQQPPGGGGKGAPPPQPSPQQPGAPPGPGQGVM